MTTTADTRQLIGLEDRVDLVTSKSHPADGMLLAAP